MNNEAKQTLVMVKNAQYGNVRIVEVDVLEFIGEEEFVISLPIDVEFNMFDDGKQLNNEIETLRSARDKGLAEAQLRANVVNDKIQSLLAIEFDHG